MQFFHSRKFIMLAMLFRRGGFVRGDFLKKHDVFLSVGSGFYWFPKILPAEPKCIKFGNNVKVASSVYFCDHDVIQHMLNDRENIDNSSKYSYMKFPIRVEDNVFIGAHSIIMGGITIGSNSIIAAGSVVVKDVPENSVVGGNPAKFLETFDEFILKRPRHLS